MPRLLFMFAAVLAAVAAGAEVPVEQYQLVRRLQLPELSAAGGVAVWPFDADFCEAVDDFKGDWRALTPTGGEVPFQVIALEIPAFRADYEPCPARIVGRGIIAGMGGAADQQVLEIELDGAASELCAVELTVSERVFEKRLTVEVAGDAGDWQRVLHHQPLIGAAGRDATESMRFYFERPVSGGRLRLCIDDLPAGDTPPVPGAVVVERVAVYRRTSEAVSGIRELEQREVELLGRSDTGRVFRYEFDARRVPLSRLDLLASGCGFRRGFRLYGSDDKEGWRTIERGEIRRSASGLESEPVSFGERRFRFYRLEIDRAGEGDPGDWEFRWAGPVYLAIFPAAPPALHLYFKGDTARPDYPELSLSSAESKAAPRYLALRPEENPAFIQEARAGRGGQAGIYLALAAGALAVAGVLLLCLARVRRPEPAA